MEILKPRNARPLNADLTFGHPLRTYNVTEAAVFSPGSPDSSGYNRDSFLVHIAFGVSSSADSADDAIPPHSLPAIIRGVNTKD
ncbi:hypothetical protein R69927_04094 [Paraburkholderia domus]|jgi:hypothetical protein|uniref:Uncharacterized protein n=1 Tax=Paraburkholderia domus TaxID=2793075 RepID=A0A9N8MQ77_9BURK|nr:hypothetical protein R70006_04202 [Paraburkholderia domus]CAE6784377.1 hypothetical protein R75483_04600 [Paraburkholderia domus]CAE6878610.1 hypothetical protein R69927_04094 [Paraburkholderia domus]CAE6888974.1 hypothetical protein R70211_02589 [Paraburkholderia domus]CAE6892722.1 hypothetical protein R69749_07701 [Paraburkholderia domus]